MNGYLDPFDKYYKRQNLFYNYKMDLNSNITLTPYGYPIDDIEHDHIMQTAYNDGFRLIGGNYIVIWWANLKCNDIYHKIIYCTIYDDILHQFRVYY